MTFTDAAAEVLRLVGRPLHYKEITDIAIEKNLLSHVGKSPEVTMGARLAAMLKKDSPENPLVRVKPGVFALREWDEKTIKAGLDGKKSKRAKVDEEPAREEEEEVVAEPVAEETAEVSADLDEAAADEAADVAEEPAAEETAEADEEPEPIEVRPAAPAAPIVAPRPSRPVIEEDEYDVAAAEPAGPDDIMRAEALKDAAEMFDEEDDDDQPILGGPADERAAQGAGDLGDGRRRRRRRRRGRTTEGGAAAPQGGLPSYTATPAYEQRRDNRDSRENRDNRENRDRDSNRDALQAREPMRDVASGDLGYRGPQVIELTGGDAHALDDLAGKDLADAVAALLGTFDRNAGAVSLRQIAEAAQRRGRLQGDVQLVQSQIAAAIRADNARRTAGGQRQRFRFAGGRVALTDWLLSSDLARFEQEALAAVERYRDAARRAFARKLGELPGHAFIEVCMLALERAGLSQLRAIRRAGAPGGEAHFAGALKSVGDDLRVAVVIRRDGREVGRERVTELRGALHHYGPATAGWILTAGQVLSGAREEASATGAAPVQLFDGLGVARLCEEQDVAVLRARLPIAIPDVDLLEALRAS
ncbi:MAG: HTH domain-containing protein [Polyangiaceae bacterium]